MLNSRPVGLVVVGAGPMGANHARAASKVPGVEVVAIVDPHESRRAALASTVRATHADSIEELLFDKSFARRLDAAIVATPTASHHPVALACVNAGLHVLVEKPFTGRTVQADDLIGRASSAEVILTIGHVERFNPAVRDVHRLVRQTAHIELVRIGPLPSRRTDDVVTDLMIHDLDLAQLFAGSEVTAVSATSKGDRCSEEETVVAELRFANGVTASVTAARGEERKRYMTVTHAGGFLEADLISHRITNRAKENRAGSTGPAPVDESWISEFTRRGDALADQLQSFCDAIQGGQATVPASAGRAAVALTEQIKSMCDRP